MASLNLLNGGVGESAEGAGGGGGGGKKEEGNVDAKERKSYGDILERWRGKICRK